MVDERLARLERELGEVKDRLAIYQLTAAYGPVVDSGDSKAAADFWIENGVYDWGRGMTEASESRARGWKDLVRIFDGQEHRRIISAGAAHWSGLPVVAIEGDTASSLCYSCLFMRTPDGYESKRVSVCLFQWVRDSGGWRIASRRNRLLDGSDDASNLLYEARELIRGAVVSSPSEGSAVTLSADDE